MIVVPSQSIVITRDQTNSSDLPAANTHTAVLWKNGTATAETVTRANPTTGVYSFAFTIPANAAQYDVWSLRVVDGDGYPATVWEGLTGPVLAELDSATLTAINAEVLDVLNVDTFAEETSVPAATASLRKKIGWMFMWFRNRVTQTGTTSTLYADDGTTPVGTHSVSDDATTFTSGEGS